MPRHPLPGGNRFKGGLSVAGCDQAASGTLSEIYVARRSIWHRAGQGRPANPVPCDLGHRKAFCRWASIACYLRRGCSFIACLNSQDDAPGYQSGAGPPPAKLDRSSSRSFGIGTGGSSACEYLQWCPSLCGERCRHTPPYLRCICLVLLFLIGARHLNLRSGETSGGLVKTLAMHAQGLPETGVALPKTLET
jgi:hypothetical protein